MKKLILLILTAILALSATALAHPGRTDENGGHYDHQSGGYHYHHGYEAHQHTGGRCPYDFEDRTGENSGSSASSSTSTSSPSISSNSSNPAHTQKEKKSLITYIKGSPILSVVFKIIGGCLLVFVVIPYLFFLCISMLSVFVYLPIVGIKENFKKAIKARDRKKQEKERLQAEYQKVSSLYSNKTKTEIARLCGMPETFYLDEDDLPHEKNNLLDIDSCTVYIAPHGSVYHCHAHCCKRNLSPVNITKVRYLNTCRYCAPPRMDLEWIDKYHETLRLMSKHGIKPIAESDRYLSKYASMTRNEIATLCGMPDGFYLDAKNLVHEQNCTDSTDCCTVYVASYGSVYHRSQYCGEHYLYPHNITQVQDKRPCEICTPVQMDLQWYDSYHETLRLMHKQGIEPLPEDF